MSRKSSSHLVFSCWEAWNILLLTGQAGWNRCWGLGHIWSPVSSKNQKRKMLGCWADLPFKVNECKRQVTQHNHWTVSVHLPHKHAPTHVNYTLPSICCLLCSPLFERCHVPLGNNLCKNKVMAIRVVEAALKLQRSKFQDTFFQVRKSKQTI